MGGPDGDLKPCALLHLQRSHPIASRSILLCSLAKRVLPILQCYCKFIAFKYSRVCEIHWLGSSYNHWHLKRPGLFCTFHVRSR